MPQMKPVLFNTEMVKANLEGRKTTTRRVVKPLPPEGARLEYSPKYGEALDYASGPYPMPGERIAYKAPYQPGDILYVREKFAYDGFDGNEDIYVYWADVDDCGRVVWGDQDNEWAPSSDYTWHPSIHMPKDAARIFLRVTEIRVERLQEITNEGAKAEGVSPIGEPRRQFAVLWETTIKEEAHTAYGWAANPWVWVIEYKRITREEAYGN